jgi:hypothetical protein
MPFTEHQIRCQLVLLPQFFQFRGDQLVRLLRERRPLVEHGLDFLVQRARVPLFDPAHLGVEVALEGIIQVDDPAEMRPTQLSAQCVDNLGIREFLGKPGHVREISRCEPLPELGHQFCTHCVQNLLPVFRPLLFEHILADAVADGPVKQD